MRRYLILLCAFISLAINAQKVSESEAFAKAQKFMGDKKLKAPRSMTRGEQVSKPYYIFNAEDENGCIIISGDERLPEVLAYSKEESIDEDNIPEGLKELIPILCGDGEVDINDYSLIPSEYVPRNTTPIEPLFDYIWSQFYPFNNDCPTIYPDREDERYRQACVGCVPRSVASVMNYFRYPKSVDAFETSIAIEMPNDTGATRYDVSVPYTEFKWDLIRGEIFKFNNPWSEEERNAVAELCYHVGCAFKVAYRQKGTYTNGTQEWVNFEDVMKSIYKYEEAKLIKGDIIKHWNEDGITYTNEYYELPDEDYWNFLDSYLERGIPVVTSGGSHSFVLNGRDERGMYYYNEIKFYVIMQPSLWRKIGTYGALIKNNYFLHLLAFVPPKEHTYRYTPTAINSTEVNRFNDGSVYNLQGQKVGDTLDGLPKGVYIIDGKKHVVK